MSDEWFEDTSLSDEEILERFMAQNPVPSRTSQIKTMPGNGIVESISGDNVLGQLAGVSDSIVWTPSESSAVTQAAARRAARATYAMPNPAPVG